MAERTPFSLKLVSPEGVQFEGEAQMAIVNGVGGDLGLLANHAPIVADLRMGIVKVEDADGTWHTWATAEGFAETSNSKALVLVEEAVRAEEIDLAAADELIEAQQNAIATADTSGAHDIYSSNKHGAEKSLAWGEHLKKVHAEFAESR